MSKDIEGLERDVETAVDHDPASIAERVRAITLATLAEGRLDAAALKEVSAAVLRGAQKGVARPGAERGEALKEAVRGLDEALAAAAQATQLALQEAAGRSGEFSRQELKRSFDELGTLEADFVNTLAEAARNASGHAQTTLRELAEHARTSGTAVGTGVAGAAAQLARAFAGLARDQVESGAQTLRNEAGLLAALASGLLRGIADRLQPPAADPAAPEEKRD